MVQVVALYNGGRYSAYTFRRYRDVRLVMAPERALGFFGGDPDNFTYPRYAADFAFFRVYGDDGRPLATPEYTSRSRPRASEAGSVVFVIGNPGRTARGLTVAQLEFLRDVEPGRAAEVRPNTGATRSGTTSRRARTTNPDQVRGTIFGLSNARKAYGGRLRGLEDEYVVARRAAAERDFRAASPRRGGAHRPDGRAPGRKSAPSPRPTATFPGLFNRAYGSALMKRALALVPAATTRRRDRGHRRPTSSGPYLEAEVAALREFYRDQNEALPVALEGETAAAAADRLLATSQAAQPSAPTRRRGRVRPGRRPWCRGLLPAIQAFQSARRRVLGARGRDRPPASASARFSPPTATPSRPDATFSLRFTDGVVAG